MSQPLEFVVLWWWQLEPKGSRRDPGSVTVRISVADRVGAAGSAIGPYDGMTGWTIDERGWRARGTLHGSTALEAAVLDALRGHQLTRAMARTAQGADREPVE